MELYFIRHGHRADQEPDYADGPNPSLSRRGFQQAAYVGEVAKKYDFDILYSSSMHRALQTAQPIREALNVPWHVWPALSETAIGVWRTMRELRDEGHSDEDIRRMREPKGEYVADACLPDEHLQQTYPHIVYSQPFKWVDAWDDHPLSLEGMEEAYERARRVVPALLEHAAQPESGRPTRDERPKRVAIVGHGNFGSVMMSVLLQVEPTPYNRFSQANTAISRIDVEKSGRVRLRFLNEQNHLPPELAETI